MSEFDAPRHVLESFLKSNVDIGFIRFERLDLFGVLRTRVVTSDHAPQLESTGRRISLQPAALWLTYVGTPG